MANEKRLIDVKDALEVLCNYCGVEGCCPEGGCAEYQKISNLPTVDAVEVVHAKAVPIYSNIKYEDTLIRMDSQCPLCGALMLKVDNYCPNCGANMMDGGADDA